MRSSPVPPHLRIFEYSPISNLKFKIGTMEDWKETLFVWDGELRVIASTDGTEKLAWTGVWQPLQTERGEKPDALLRGNELKRSERNSNSFKLIGKITNDNFCNWSGSYYLDQGDGHIEVSDHQHYCKFFEDTISIDQENNMRSICDIIKCIKNPNPVKGRFSASACSVICAWGTTEFGPFTSRGWVYPVKEKEESSASTASSSSSSSYTYRLTLARRYLAPNDARCGPLDSVPYDVINASHDQLKSYGELLLCKVMSYRKNNHINYGNMKKLTNKSKNSYGKLQPTSIFTTTEKVVPVKSSVKNIGKTKPPPKTPPKPKSEPNEKNLKLMQMQM